MARTGWQKPTVRPVRPREDDLELRLAIVAFLALLLLWLGWPFLTTPASADEGPAAAAAISDPLSDPASGPHPEAEPAVELGAEEKRWLEEVAWLILDEEKEVFRGLEEPFRRKAFVEQFWQVRDTDPNTHMNELRLTWAERMALAESKFGRIDDDRVRFFMLNGEPAGRCLGASRHYEVWWYHGSLRTGREFVVLFQSPGPRRTGIYEIYTPGGWFFPASRGGLASTRVRELCNNDEGQAAKGLIDDQILEGYEKFVYDLMALPEPPSLEWLSTFLSRSTLLPANAERFPAELSLRFPGRHQQRTVLQGLVTVPAAVLRPESVAATATAENREIPRPFLLVGEVVREGEIFETFRYRFEPAVDGSGPVPLVFQRYLRPGPATLILKVEDLLARRFARLEQTVEIPRTTESAGLPGLESSEIYQLLREAETATARGERKLRLLPPPGVVHTGLTRFATLLVGELDKAVFYLDDQPILTKNRPPFSVELDLGDLPGVHRLRVSGLDADGEEVASDEILLNPGGQSFRVRVVEPRQGRNYAGSVRAVVDVQVPDGEVVERVELYLGETPVATLYQEPYTQPLVLADGELTYVRAVAHLADGHSSEDLVFVNAPGTVERVDVQFVELYAGVLDDAGRPVLGLEADDFVVREDGRVQTPKRFEWQRDLPIRVALLLDTSASMESRLTEAGQAARRFVESILRPMDRAAVLAFDHQPRVERRFTNDLDSLALSLDTLRAEGGTALYDSLAFALHYFHGLKGQRALLLLSDGRDESSVFTLDHVLEYVERAGVVLYAVGIGDGIDRPQRKVLSQLADITGGRAFFVDGTGALDGVYREVEKELRSRYLVAYQSDSRRDPSELRRIEVEVLDDKGRPRRDVEVRTSSGYYPSARP